MNTQHPIQNQPASPSTPAAPPAAHRLTRVQLLALVLRVDAAVLFVLGMMLMLAPHRVEEAFHMTTLPPAANYVLSLFGCALASLGLGYASAARDPLRNIVWIQISIARGALEFVIGLLYVLAGVVTWRQAGFGIVVAGLMTLAYVLYYPHPPRVTVVDAAEQ